MRRWLPLVALLLLPIGAAGCGPGYLHTHPHICPDGEPRTHRHFHEEDSRGGHHAPEPGDPEYHREMAWSD